MARPTIEGPADSWLRSRVRRFCDSLDGDPWGSDPPGRLVIARDYAAALRQHLPPPDLEAWERRQQGRDTHALNVGMGFMARDGVSTAVVLTAATIGRDQLLSVICHEICEASMNMDHHNPTDLDAAMSRVLWSEHVVERRCSTRFQQFGWHIETIGARLCEQLRDYEIDFPQLREVARRAGTVPDRVYAYWQFLAREFACTLGRARGGSTDDIGEVDAFIRQQNAERKRAWREIECVLDHLSKCPNSAPSRLDTRASKGWRAIWNVLRDEWNAA